MSDLSVILKFKSKFQHKPHFSAYGFTPLVLSYNWVVYSRQMGILDLTTN